MIALIGGGGIAKGIADVVPGCELVTDVDVVTLVDHPTIAAADAVVNCAGVSYPCTVAESTYDLWHREIEVNLIGAYNVARAASPDATLIFIASVAASYGKPGHSGYSASKAGVRSLVQSLAMEGRDAYAVSPGRVNTPMRERDFPGEDIRTRLDPAEVGYVVAEILNGDHDPGDNLVVRKIGFETHRRVDKGEPWRTYLKVGEPVHV